jgi:hypothetical protein
MQQFITFNFQSHVSAINGHPQVFNYAKSARLHFRLKIVLKMFSFKNIKLFMFPS